MAILKIARMGHPVLRQPARPIEDPTAPEIRHLVGDMYETMLDAAGAGLAAPQVHVPLRLVIFLTPDDDEDQAEPAEPELTVLINPVLEPIEAALEEDWEGCLSVPGLRGLVPRPAKVRYRGLGLDGGTIERTVEGFHARVVQHECDHLDGILYPQRMSDLSKLMFDSELRHYAETPVRRSQAAEAE